MDEVIKAAALQAEEGHMIVSALLEPSSGHTVEDILARLSIPEVEIHRLGAQIVSFTGERRLLDPLDGVADIHINPYQKLSDRYL